MTLRDIFIGLIAWCLIAGVGIAFVLLNRPPDPPLEIANTGSGAWDFNATDYPRDDHGHQIRVFATCPWTPWALPKNEGLSKT